MYDTETYCCESVVAAIYDVKHQDAPCIAIVAGSTVMHPQGGNAASAFKGLVVCLVGVCYFFDTSFRVSRFARLCVCVAVYVYVCFAGGQPSDTGVLTSEDGAIVFEVSHIRG